MAKKVAQNKYWLFLFKEYRLIKLIFLSLASYLVLKAFYAFVIVKPTYTSNAKRNLVPEDFPEFILCPDESIDVDIAKSKGYGGMWNYFSGDLSKGQIGWIGNNSEDVKDVFREISTLQSIDDCPLTGSPLLSTTMHTNKQSKMSELIHFNLTKALYPNHMCCKVYPPKLAKLYPLEKIRFIFNISQGFSVHLSDQMTASYFNLHKTNMLGDKIVSGEEGEYVSYKVQIWEDDKLVDDPAYPCIDYKIQGEYAECVEKEMLRKNSELLNCTPPWMTENEDLWCKGVSTLQTVERSNWEIFNNNMENDSLFRYLAKSTVKLCK